MGLLFFNKTVKISAHLPNFMTASFGDHWIVKVVSSINETQKKLSNARNVECVSFGTIRFDF